MVGKLVESMRSFPEHRSCSCCLSCLIERCLELKEESFCTIVLQGHCTKSPLKFNVHCPLSKQTFNRNRAMATTRTRTDTESEAGAETGARTREDVPGGDLVRVGAEAEQKQKQRDEQRHVQGQGQGQGEDEGKGKEQGKQGQSRGRD